MARLVQQHTDVGLGLVIRNRGTRLDRPLDGRFEVVDAEVEVDHHELAPVLGRPR